MPRNLNALAVILFLAASGFFVARRSFCQIAVPPEDFVRRRNLWLGITLIAFLAYNFWLYIVAAGMLLYYYAPRDRNIPALYFLLLFAVPPISAAISGIGIIQTFFIVDYIRLLSLTVLMPVAFKLRRQEAASRDSLTSPDKILFAYIILNIVLSFFAVSFTSMLRGCFYAFIDIVLPYYVFSRSLRTQEAFRDVLSSFVIAGTVMAVIGMFEFFKGWLLYRSLSSDLGQIWDLVGGYIERNGALRTMTSTGQPIAMGYVMAVAIGCYLFTHRLISGRLLRMGILALLVAGEVVPLSRGPWMGSVAIVLVYLATGPNAMSRMAKLAALSLVALAVLYLTPYFKTVIDMLPFVGTVDEGSMTYRQRLLEIGTQIVLANPLFGSSDFLRFMESLRQGQGIIDIVNSYLLVALNCGLVGLSLFVGFFVVIVSGTYKAMRQLPDDSELHQLGQTLIAILAGILFMIFSVSPITFVPPVYWSMAGLGMAYIRFVKSASVVEKA